MVNPACVSLLLAFPCRLLTADWSDRTVVHVELELADSGMRFTAGDAVGVLPSNDPALVAALLSRLGVDGDDVFEVEPVSGESQHTLTVWECVGWAVCGSKCASRHAPDLCSNSTLCCLLLPPPGSSSLFQMVRIQARCVHASGT